MIELAFNSDPLAAKRFSGGSGETSSLLTQQLAKVLSSLETASPQKSPSATTAAMNLFDSKVAFKRKTAEVAMHFDNAWRQGFFRQLDSLLDEDSWDAEEPPPTVASFQTLLRTILHLKPHRRPGLGATSGGNFIASWSVDDCNLTIECRADDKLRWFVSRAGETGGGQVHLSRLRDVLEPYEPSVWFSHAT